MHPPFTSPYPTSTLESSEPPLIEPTAFRLGPDKQIMARIRLFKNNNLNKIQPEQIIIIEKNYKATIRPRFYAGHITKQHDLENFAIIRKLSQTEIKERKNKLKNYNLK